MINLLAPDRSANLRYGHFNSILKRWLITTILAAGGLVLIVAMGWLYIANQSRNLTNSLSSTKQQLQAQDLAGVQKQAMTISSNIKIINQVLSREIRFSDLVQQIGTVMPTGTVLASLTLNKVDGAIDLSATGRDYTSAAQIAVNLGDPKNNIFQKVDIISINCSSGSTSAYPCNATFKALFSPATKKQFLNVPAGASR
ncbi:hypothetical protein HYW35_02025 [Candidatus Saccharibacteria bacterium]|nr:hypothetical protein [Candidatus Saccharibacteria bacterium]